MAVSGSVYTNTISRSSFYVNWEQVSQSVANNSTKINWTAGLYTGTSSAHDMFYSNAVKIKKVVINGTTVYSNGTFSNITTGGNHDLASGTLDISHNSDGTKSFSISITGWTYADSDYSGESAFTLTNIPRQATLTAAPNFNDEQNPTITYSNPAGNSVTSLEAYIQNQAGTVSYADLRSISKTGTSYTFNLTDQERTALRNATPNSNTMTVKFVIKTVIGGTAYYSTLDKTLTIVNANPTISSRTYKDTNSTTTAITNNNQVIIQNTSTAQFTFTTITSLKGATLSSVAVTINGVTKSSSLSGSSVASKTLNFGTINSSSNLNASIVVTDSRGNKKTYTKAITIWAWSLPTAIITCQRKNNFYSETDINVNADYSSLSNHNQITIKYQYKKTTASSWSSQTTLQDNVPATFTIDNNYAWNVKVIVTDLLGTTTYNLFVDKGTPIAYFDTFNNSTGFNCFPQNQGSVEIADNLIVDGKNILNMFTGVGSICASVTGSWNTACGDATGFYMGQNLSNSPSGTTASGWWWVLHIVHNSNYQRQIAFSFVENSGIYTRIKNNGTWNNWTQV